MGEPKLQDKPFEISKWAVWEAYRKVKANKGAPGVDGQSLAVFETDLQGNLYKIWNRMSSGSYLSPCGPGGRDTQGRRAGCARSVFRRSRTGSRRRW